jgi:hypothetical protein
MAIWYILQFGHFPRFDMFYQGKPGNVLVYFGIFPRFDMFYLEKSGNPA